MGVLSPHNLSFFQPGVDISGKLSNSEKSVSPERTNGSQRNSLKGSARASSWLPEFQSLDLSVGDEIEIGEQETDRKGANEVLSSNRSGLSLFSSSGQAALQKSLEQIKENQESLPKPSDDLESAPSDGKSKLRTTTLQSLSKKLEKALSCIFSSSLFSDQESRAPSKTLVTEEDIAWDNLALVDRHLWSSAPSHRPSTPDLNGVRYVDNVLKE